MFRKTCISKFTTNKGSIIDVDVEVIWIPRFQRYRLEIILHDITSEIYSDDIPLDHRGESDIENLDAVYLSLYDNKADGSLDYIIEKLKALGIEVTSDFLTQCRAFKEKS